MTPHAHPPSSVSSPRPPSLGEGGGVAEDPSSGFLPATGTLAAFAPAGEPAVRFDSGVEAGTTIGVDFDPMLAKVIAHAPTRREAAAKLARAMGTRLSVLLDSE